MKITRSTIIAGTLIGCFTLATGFMDVYAAQPNGNIGNSSTMSPTTANSVSTTANPPTPATEVPNIIPSNGVIINNDQALLMPPELSNPPISETQAVSIAQSYDNAPGRSVTSVKLTDFTLPGSIPGPGTTVPFRTIKNVPAWVVTFTSPTPVNVSQAPSGFPIYVTHDNLVINAKDGSFLAGFFTK